MSRYDLVEDLRQCAAQLDEELSLLQQQLTSLPLLVGRVFSLPAVTKGAEHDPITQISVTQHLGDEARQLALQHYCRLFIQRQSENISTKAAVRLPGALCFEADSQQHALLHQ
ncbi:MAG: DNA replication terminus site-binding protein, partial [Pantoea sp.]|nr:DNA replication terminus site-binding protein [Pantoea sp.]